MSWILQLDQLNTNFSSWAAGLGTTGEALLRLVLAGVCGGVVGLEREVRGRQAGFRTYLLVCLGSALVMIVSSSVADHNWRQVNDQYSIRVDPGRIAYGIMMGIGFLGAGVIVKDSDGTVRGLTTAAALWCIAAVGLALGFGLYILAILGCILIVVALWILDMFEDWLPKMRYRTVTVRRKWDSDCIVKTVALFKKAKFSVVDASFVRSLDLLTVDISIHIAFINRQQYYAFERTIEQNGDYLLISTHQT